MYLLTYLLNNFVCQLATVWRQMRVTAEKLQNSIAWCCI